MRLIVITTETFWEGEVDVIHTLFKYGLERLHVRKPFSSRDDMKHFLEQIDGSYYSRIVLHDHYELVEMFDVKGIHINDRNMGLFCDNYSMLAAKKVSFSVSLHSIEDLQFEKRHDYVCLSPVFDSISKPGYKKGFTAKKLMKAKEKGLINRRIIALGGITARRIPIARNYGFGGVAVLGALWGASGDDRNEKAILKRFNKLQIKCMEG